MSDDNLADFEAAMTFFDSGEYQEASKLFYDMTQREENDQVSSNILTLASLYCHLSDAASGSRRSLRMVLEPDYLSEGEINSIQTTYIRKYLTDFKRIMESVFNYQKDREMFAEIIEWYNQIITESKIDIDRL